MRQQDITDVWIVGIVSGYRHEVGTEGLDENVDGLGRCIIRRLIPLRHV